MTATDTQRLERIRAELTELECRQLTLSTDGNKTWLEGLEPESRVRVRIAAFDQANIDEIQFYGRAVETVTFLLGLVDRASKELRRARSEGFIARKNFAAEASIKCGNLKFRQFLSHLAGLAAPADEKAAPDLLRKQLGIVSRRDLSEDDDAADRWLQLRGEFEAWLKEER